MEAVTTEVAKKFVCPHCGKELDSIENRASTYLEWDDDVEGYCWNDPWDAGTFWCEHCEAEIDPRFLSDIISEANA